MAGEILHSSLETDVRMADIIAGEVMTLLADTWSIRDVPGALMYAGSVNGRGSDTLRIPYIQLDALSATGAENTSVSNTALTDTSFTIAVTRKALAREISDLARLTSRSGANDVELQRLAGLMVGGTNQAFMDAVAAAGAAFSSTVGTSGANLTVSDIFDAVATLEIASNNGPFFGLLHPRQLADLQSSLRAEGGALQHVAATQEMVNIKGQGFAGQFLGIDFFQSSRVDTANSAADRAGFIWSAGALAYADGTVLPVPGAVMSQPTPLLTVEIQRPDRTATSLVIAHSYFGVSLAEDARGVAVITDA